MMAERSTLRDVVFQSISRYGGNEASSYFEGRPWHYAEVGSAIASLMGYFKDRGIQPGDRIALLSENQPSWSAVYLAATSYGAIIVPILPDFTVADINGILTHSEALLIFASKKQMEKLDELRGTRVGMPETVVLDDVLETHVGSTDSENDGVEHIKEILTAIADFPAPKPDDTAAVIYTSGTTGHSKGVELSHWNIVSNAESADYFAHIKPAERLLSILPLAHTYECTLGMVIPFSRGAHVFYLGRAASPTYLMKALSTVRPHLMLSVPLLIEKIVRAKVIPQLSQGAAKALRGIPILGGIVYRAAGKKLRRAFGGELRFFGIGGAPLSVDVESVLFKMKFPYAIGYGLTETAPLLAGTSPYTNHLRSTGIATPGVELRIKDGEIQARGPNVMKGYYHDPERTAEVFTEDGWFRTGDLGEFDTQHRLFVKGRSKTVILGASGENIYPEVIESVINEFAGVEEALVVQEGNQLVARVKVDYDHLTENARQFAENAMKRAGQAINSAGSAASNAAGNAADHAKKYLDDLRKRVNERLSSFNRISEMREQKEPFVKTPTSKIKRYLYQRNADGVAPADTGSAGGDTGGSDEHEPAGGASSNNTPSASNGANPEQRE